MTVQVIFENDIPIRRLEGDVIAVEATLVPDHLAILPMGALRLVNGVVTDIRGVTKFYVDMTGSKHVVQTDPKWQAVECSWNVRLLYTADGRWRLNTETDSLLRLVQRLRYHKEMSGIIVNNMRIKTDLNSQMRIFSASLAGQSVRWKADNGWFDLTPQDVAELAKAITAHIQKCFEIEEILIGRIASGELKTKPQVVEAFEKF